MSGWFMEDGVSHFYDSGKTVTMRFAGGRPGGYRAEAREIIASQKRPDEMNIRELARHIEILRSQGAETQKLEVDWHLKWAIPLPA